MNSNVNDQQDRLAVEDQARDWFVINRSGEMSSEEKHAFLDWLQASELHVAAYLRLAEMMEFLPQAAGNPHRQYDSKREEAPNITEATEARPLSPMDSVPSMRMASRLSTGKIVAGGAIACAVAILLIWKSEPVSHSTAETVASFQSFHTLPGERRAERLSDGTVIELNFDTAFKTRYSDVERHIEFDRGEARFNVIRDSRRRFRVQTPYGNIIALGTLFTIQQTSSSTTVIVMGGKVQLTHLPLSKPVATAQAVRWTPVEVDAGKQATLSNNGPPLISAVSVTDPTTLTQTEVDLSNRRLGDVADEFNKHNTLHIIIEDAQAREHLVDGVFLSYDVESLVSYLSHFEDLEVIRETESVRVRSRRNE